MKVSGEKFKQVAQQVAALEALVIGISQAAHERALGVEQISIAVTEMSTVTNENTAMVQQTMAAARSLEELAGKQTQALSFFKVEG